MTTLRLRHDIRAITDALPEGGWITRPQIFAQLPEPKPGDSNFDMTLAVMVDRGMLRRRKAPKGSGRGIKHCYRSGKNPVVDGRLALKGKRLRKSAVLGFAALARLRESDPVAYRKATRAGR